MLLNKVLVSQTVNMQFTSMSKDLIYYQGDDVASLKDYANEVMIPEVLAIKLANDNDFSTYTQLLGTNLQLNDNECMISGVYSGDNTLILGKDKIDSNQVIFIRGNKAEKKELINNFGDEQIVDNGDFLLNNILLILPTIINFLLIIGLWIITYFELRENIKILNHYKYRLSNTIIPLLIPFGFGAIIILALK